MTDKNIGHGSIFNSSLPVAYRLALYFNWMTQIALLALVKGNRLSHYIYKTNKIVIYTTGRLDRKKRIQVSM